MPKYLILSIPINYLRLPSTYILQLINSNFFTLLFYGLAMGTKVHT